MSHSLAIALDRYPRFPLGHWPTPLEKLERLTAHLGGAEIYVKRDDCSGLALGGNKVRKLEYLIAEAKAAGHDTIVTVGGVQSNHCRQAAAAAARAGLACEVVLARLVPDRAAGYEDTGNVLLERLLGATVHIVRDPDAAAKRVLSILGDLEARGSSGFFVPSGGSTPVGGLGYARAALELAEQMRASGLTLDRIVLAVSSGGTLAGLLVGLHALGRDIPVTAIAVYEAAERSRATVLDLAAGISALLGVDPLAPERIDIRDGFRGEGYGLPTSAMQNALDTCARVEGLLIDPVYTGKAMAGLFALVGEGAARRGEAVLFWHTGGTPALPAYPELVVAPRTAAE